MAGVHDREKSLAESNAELEAVIVNAAADMYLRACAYDIKTKTQARKLAEGLVGTEEFERIVEARRPKLKQLQEIIASMGLQP